MNKKITILNNRESIEKSLPYIDEIINDSYYISISNEQYWRDLKIQYLIQKKQFLEKIITTDSFYHHLQKLWQILIDELHYPKSHLILFGEKYDDSSSKNLEILPYNENESQFKLKICPQCGSSLLENYKFCDNCGTRITSIASSTVTSSYASAKFHNGSVKKEIGIRPLDINEIQLFKLGVILVGMAYPIAILTNLFGEFSLITSLFFPLSIIILGYGLMKFNNSYFANKTFSSKREKGKSIGLNLQIFGILIIVSNFLIEIFSIQINNIDMSSIDVDNPNSVGKVLSEIQMMVYNLIPVIIVLIPLVIVSYKLYLVCKSYDEWILDVIGYYPTESQYDAYIPSFRKIGLFFLLENSILIFAYGFLLFAMVSLQNAINNIHRYPLYSLIDTGTFLLFSTQLLLLTAIIVFAKVVLTIRFAWKTHSQLSQFVERVSL